MRLVAFTSAIFVAVWVLYSIGQSVATGNPLSQCLMSARNDCGIPRVDCPAVVSTVTERNDG